MDTQGNISLKINQISGSQLVSNTTKDENNGLTIKNTKHYNLFQQICCCKCFSNIDKVGRLQIDGKSIWNNFKQKFQSQEQNNQMIEQNLIDQIQYNINEKTLNKLKKNQILDPQDVLLHLYDIDNNISQQLLKNCRMNPDYSPQSLIRNDLEYYIPQLITYMVFFKQLDNQHLNNMIMQMCTFNHFFGHLVYWNLNSNQMFMDYNNKQIIPQVQQILEKLMNETQISYKDQFCIAISSLLNQPDYQNKEDQLSMKIKDYQNNSIKIQKLKFYKSIYNKQIDNEKDQEQQLQQNSEQDIEIQSLQQIYQSNGFQSNIDFFNDLLSLSEELTLIKKKPKQFKMNFLKQQFEQINEKLPAAVYVPFFKQSLRNHVILNIVQDESILFETKERVPFYICLEVFRPEEDLQFTQVHQKQSMIEKIENKLEILKNKQKIQKTNGQDMNQLDCLLSKPLTFNNYQNIKDNISQNSFKIRSYTDRVIQKDQIFNSLKEQLENNKTNEINQQFQYRKRLYSDNQFYEDKLNDQQNDSQEKLKNQANELSQEINHSDIQLSEIEVKMKMNQDDQLKKQRKQLINQIVFGQSSHDQSIRIKSQSKYQDFKSWKLAHFIVKTGDNIKQEQLALQLVYQFEQIFKKEKLSLFIQPYEIVSMNPTSGIIEMIKDAVSIDSLKQKLYQQFKRYIKLKDYFNYFYISKKELQEAKKNFCRSLAGYSLLCYFLQVKDRHNGNILINKKGQIIHIDFGFFISNSPGMGLEFEKNIPFKFNQEYLDILGGPNSKLFGYFRKLFFKGFKALKKHQDKILVLIKMMYSGHKESMPCFKGGDKCVDELYGRFNPQIDEQDDGALNIFTQNLINKALNNYRTHWYDKYQYYFQGIFY